MGKNIDSANNSALKTIYPGDNLGKSCWEIFSNGVKAIQLKDDERVNHLWSEIFDSNSTNNFGYFWKNDLDIFSKHHIKSRSDLGDMIRYFPNSWGHTARKIFLEIDKSTGKIMVTPEYFNSNTCTETLDQRTLRKAWELASDIFVSSLPRGQKVPDYKVTLQILRYPESLEHFNNIFSLLVDSSSGKWTKLGQKLDQIRSKILNSWPFDIPIISWFYWQISKIPIVNLFLIPINNTFFRKYASSSDDLQILGPPHVDSNRAITMLIGERDSIVTEVYHDKQWQEIKINPTTLHILPGGLWAKDFKLKPTFHRYSIRRDNNSPNGSESLNVTLVLGIVESK